MNFIWASASPTVDLANDLGLSAETQDPGHRLRPRRPRALFRANLEMPRIGIDLSEEFIDVANALNGVAACRASDIQHASAHGDAVCRQFLRPRYSHPCRHEHREQGCGVCADAARLAQGGLISVYDVMRFGNGEIPYRMPWAQTLETSFVDAPEDYLYMLRAVGVVDRLGKEPPRHGVETRTANTRGCRTQRPAAAKPAHADRVGSHRAARQRHVLSYGRNHSADLDHRPTPCDRDSAATALAARTRRFACGSLIFGVTSRSISL